MKQILFTHTNALKVLTEQICVKKVPFLKQPKAFTEMLWYEIDLSKLDPKQWQWFTQQGVVRKFPTNDEFLQYCSSHAEDHTSYQVVECEGGQIYYRRDFTDEELQRYRKVFVKISHDGTAIAFDEPVSPIDLTKYLMKAIPALHP